jgi:hypothetical protein
MQVYLPTQAGGAYVDDAQGPGAYVDDAAGEGPGAAEQAAGHAAGEGPGAAEQAAGQGPGAAGTCERCGVSVGATARRCWDNMCVRCCRNRACPRHWESLSDPEMANWRRLVSLVLFAEPQWSCFLVWLGHVP